MSNAPGDYPTSCGSHSLHHSFQFRYTISRNKFEIINLLHFLSIVVIFPGGGSGDDDDCPSKTGLIAGIIVTSILGVVGLCAAGYAFYLLRRANSAPPYNPLTSEGSKNSSPFSAEAPPPSSSEPPPRTSIDYDTPTYQRFGSVSAPPPTSSSDFPVASTTVAGGLAASPLLMAAAIPPTSSSDDKEDPPPPQIEPDYEDEPGGASSGPRLSNDYETLGCTMTEDATPPSTEQEAPKSIMKAPGEIEPDYAGATPTPVPTTDAAAPAPLERKMSVAGTRVGFAPADEVISIRNEDELDNENEDEWL